MFLVKAFKDYFDYATTTQEIERSSYTEAEWQQRIYDEIKRKTSSTLHWW